MAPADRRRREVDEVDLKLLTMLANDGRISNRELAKAVSLTEATVAARLRRLVDDAVISVSAVFDREAAGYRWSVFLTVEVEGRAPRDVAEEITGMTGVQSVSIVLGAADLIIHLVAGDREALISALQEMQQVKGVHNVTSDVELRTVQYRWGQATLPISSAELDFPDPVVELDELDRGLLAALVEDGRQSNREIARQLGVADGTIRSRIRRLEDAGLLRIVGQVDPVALGDIGWIAYVGIATRDGLVEEVAERLAALPSVSWCAITTGRHDLLAIVGSVDRSQFTALLLDEIRVWPGVRSTEAWEAIDVVMHDPRWVRFVEAPGGALVRRG